MHVLLTMDNQNYNDKFLKVPSVGDSSPSQMEVAIKLNIALVIKLDNRRFGFNFCVYKYFIYVVVYFVCHCLRF